MAVRNDAPRRVFSDIRDLDQRLLIGAIDIGLGIKTFVVGDTDSAAQAGESLEHDLGCRAQIKHGADAKDEHSFLLIEMVHNTGGETDAVGMG